MLRHRDDAFRRATLRHGQIWRRLSCVTTTGRRDDRRRNSHQQDVWSSSQGLRSDARTEVCVTLHLYSSYLSLACPVIWGRRYSV